METKVTLYACHDGIVKLYRNAPKYREYLSITTEIHDRAGNLKGRMVSIYAHLDLEMDEIDGFSLAGMVVQYGSLTCLKTKIDLSSHSVGTYFILFENGENYSASHFTIIKQY